MYNIFLSHELTDVLTYFDVDSIMLIHQLCHYTNSTVLTNLPNLYIRDNIINCDTYREYILRISMTKLTCMSRYVTSDCKYLELCVKSGLIQLDDFTDNHIVLPDDMNDKEEAVHCIIELIRLGITTTKLLGSADEPIIQQVIINLMHEYAYWRDNTKVRNFVASLYTKIDIDFTDDYILHDNILLLLLSNYPLFESLTDMNKQDVAHISDAMIKDTNLFISCDFDDQLDDKEIWEVLSYSSDWVAHITDEHINVLLDKEDIILVSYVLTQISPKQLDDIRDCIIQYTEHVIEDILFNLLIRYKRIDLFKLIFSWTSVDCKLQIKDSSKGEHEIYTMITKRVRTNP